MVYYLSSSRRYKAEWRGWEVVRENERRKRGKELRKHNAVRGGSALE